MLALAILGGVLVVALLAWIAVERLAWRRSGRPDPWSGSGGSGVVGLLDEALHPSAARSSEVRVVERELPAPAPAPGDPPAPGDGQRQ